jgi:hypothetical protein
MYKRLVKNLFIGKSKLIFYKKGFNLVRLPDTTTFSELYIVDVGFPTMLCEPQREALQDRLPDIMLYGELSIYDQSFTMDINNPTKGTDRLFITGISLGTPDLDKYRFKNAIWSSYYEDDHRGYLFQVV